MNLIRGLLPILGLSPVILAAPAKQAVPTVTIASPKATVLGSSGAVEKFNAIPFAQPPTGSLRLKPPQLIQTSLGTVDGTGSAKSCPQFFFSTDNTEFPGSVTGLLINNPLFQKITNAGEDCLTLNVARPAGTTPDSKLPVLVWIYGGGFELGGTSTYDGTALVASSIALDMPVVFVAMNYRVGGFGFLPGKEILADGAANLGLLDQRLALQWVADNIAAFGGDPDKVTIWGESAGSISVFDHMILYDGDHTYKGKPLFRGAMMNSGSAIPADPVDSVKGQQVYDAVVDHAGCSSAADTLECLRALDYTDFLNAANAVPGILSYRSVALSYLPRPDGKVLTDSPDKLGKAGKYAPVPFIIGDQEDEGTLFALFQSNITTTRQVVDYLGKYFFYGASRAQLEELVATYPDVTTDGSPFRTGIFNNWYPQFKRLAALLGDLTFTLTRRAYLKYATEIKPDLPCWSYISSYDYGTPIMGTFHASDILQVFYGILPNYASRAFHTYYLSFVYDLDPNARRGNLMEWPQWNKGQQVMQIFNNRGALLADDFRNDTYNFILNNVDSFHI
ncbi:putative extracellular lipase [Aspergillus clavatus NRRL 1]|uniref:Carboxylic ester hydrolase n=1 Tax=Aspergillus clavatus (strain ATCC 1007 / CBS 513.65 / DSM 816 / NCTC 3887 / NRRL 1 / QM 1276 / 107) TaxID=344612 RepID=A1C8G4_ASPCL|nr:extracellular lipase, putative [Aspergillus clavatus NRRL 1]EAW13601.1 extracellular lipase, putative [Aspergillus clavatus NRRL 1]